MNVSPVAVVGERKSLGPPFVMLGVALVGMLVGGCFTGVFFVGTGAAPNELAASADFLLAALAVSQLALLGAVLYVPRWAGDVGAGGLMERAGWRGGVRWLDVVPVWLGCLGLGGLALTLLWALSARQTGMLTQLSATAKGLGGPGFTMLLLFGAVLPGVGEELAFRGVLQSRLVERFGPAVGISLTALLFGVWHFDVRQGVTAVVLGLWWGLWAHRLNTIVPVVFAHMLNNATGFLASRFEHGAQALPLGARLVVWVTLVTVAAAVLWRRPSVPSAVIDEVTPVSAGLKQDD